MAGPVEPMLATGSTGASGRHPVDLATLVATGDWVLDTKIDGERAIVHDGRIFNRRGADVTHVWPDVDLPRFPGTFDGEIITLDGKFETTLLRSSQSAPHAIRRLAEQHPARFVAFDRPNFDPWLERRQLLEAMVRDYDVTVTPVSYDDTLWHTTKAQGMEGVIAKRITSRYQPGRRSTDWVKFKHLHRVTCVAVGYEPGKGSRQHFGAMFLALVGPSGPVRVGRVGSGFTESQTHQMKALLDNGQMPVVEIECANVTSGGTLRFPVYRGQRLDVAVTDCTTDQLDTIPRTG